MRTFTKYCIAYVVFLLGIALLLGHCSDKKDDKVPYYDLLPSCVQESKPDPAKFHCEIDDVKNLKHIVCDPGSFDIILKPGSTTDTCLTIHVHRPEGAEHDSK